MAAAPEPLLPEPLSLMTVDEYWQLPSRDDAIEELHWGQLVVLSFPKQIHKRIQRRLIALLGPIAGEQGVLDIELAFRALPEYEVRGADVAYVPKDRYEAIGDNDYLRGSPEIVFEVLSRSNTKAEMREKAALCLATGTVEFWIVDPGREVVTILRRGEMPATYTSADQIPLALFDGQLAVADIFSR